MSDAHEHDAHEGAAHAHDDHGFDGEPAKELGPGEPMTPGWVPALGGALFAGLAMFGLLVSRDDDAAAGSPAATTQAAAPATGNAAAPQIQPRPVPLPSTLRPSPVQSAAPNEGAQAAPGSPQIKRMSPSELQEVQRRIHEMQQKQGQKPGGQ